MGTDSGHNQQHDIGEGNPQRNLQDSRRPALTVAAMDMHLIKFTGTSGLLQESIRIHANGWCCLSAPFCDPELHSLVVSRA